MTTPGYPVFGTHSKYYGGLVHNLPLTAEHEFLPDLKSIPADVLKKAKVLVLNQLYMAVRVVSARRAFILLCKELAEVIHVDDGKYVNYNFDSWREVAALQREFERERHDWVRTVRYEIAVPRIIRLLG